MKLYQYLTVPYLTVPYLTVPYRTYVAATSYCNMGLWSCCVGSHRGWGATFAGRESTWIGYLVIRTAIRTVSYRYRYCTGTVVR